MLRLPLKFLCCACVFLAQPLQAKPKPVAATVILAEAETVYFEAGRRHKIDVGEELGREAKLETPKTGGLHLVLANGSSLILGPSSALELRTLDLPPAPPRYHAMLSKGTLAAFIEEKDGLLNLELATPAAIAIAKKGHVELSYNGDESRLSVDKGSAELWDKDRKKSESVAAMHSASLSAGRFERATRMSKRDAGALRQRWQRNEMVHTQRAEIAKNLKQGR